MPVDYTTMVVITLTSVAWSVAKSLAVFFIALHVAKSVRIWAEK